MVTKQKKKKNSALDLTKTPGKFSLVFILLIFSVCFKSQFKVLRCYNVNKDVPIIKSTGGREEQGGSGDVR